MNRAAIPDGAEFNTLHDSSLTTGIKRRVGIDNTANTMFNAAGLLIDDVPAFTVSHTPATYTSAATVHV